MRKSILLVLFIGLAFIPGCKKPSAPAEGLPAKPAEETPAAESQTRKVVGFSQCTFEDPWRINMNKEMEVAVAEAPGIKLVIANGENRNAKQIADIENFMVMGVSLLVVSPRESAPLTSAVEKAFDAGIPVVVLDRKIDSEKYTMFIGASNLEIGREAGKYMAEKLKGKGSVVEIEGILGATPTQERSQGFHEVIASYPGIKVAYKQPGDYKRSPARQVMENALQAIDKIDAVYAHNDEMMIGAYLAAKAAGREKDMVFVGIDGQREAVEMIRQGLLDATFVYPNGSKEAVEYGRKILAGNPAPAGPKTLQLPTTRITRDEALDYKGF